jgi:hypothetical protein
MKNFYFLFSLILLAPLFSSAQNNYKPGYVVTLNGDTVKGYINYREWDKNPKNISFKKDLTATAEEFTPENTGAFGITGFEYFKSCTVPISQAQVETGNLKVGVDSSYITANVFLRVLTVGGNVSVFSYEDDIKTRYYILEHGRVQPAELIYRIYYRGDNANDYKTDNIYQIQLQSLAQKYNVDSYKLQVQLTTAQYSESDIIKIAKAINGDNAVQFTPESRLGTGWFAGIGIADNVLTFTGGIAYPPKKSFFPKIAAGFDLYPNKNIQKFFFRAEVSFTANQYSFPEKPDAEGLSSYSISNIMQRTVSGSAQVVYNIYSAENVSVFIGAGVSINISSYNNYHFTQYNNMTSTTTNEFPGFVHVWDSVPLKAGITLNKKLEFYAGYTPKADLTNYDNAIYGNFSTYQAGVNYLFGIK